jgi:hypothetical protein
MRLISDFETAVLDLREKAGRLNFNLNRFFQSLFQNQPGLETGSVTKPAGPRVHTNRALGLARTGGDNENGNTDHRREEAQGR